MIFFISTPPHYRKSSNGLIFASKRGGPSLRLIKRNVPGEYNLTVIREENSKLIRKRRDKKGGEEKIERK